MVAKVRLLALLLLVAGVVLGGSGPTGAQGDRQTVTYAPTDAVFPNPERGFYQQDAPLWLGTVRYPQDADDLAALRAQGVSLLRWYFLIDEFRNGPMSADALAYVGDQFTAARQAGLKVIPRFAYNFPIGGEYPYTDPDARLNRVLRHIDQLKPVLRANSDVIAFVEIGFVGAWGEWHSSTNGLVDPDTGVNGKSRRIVTRLLGALPSDRMVAMRYTPYKQQLYGPNPTTLAESLRRTSKARMGAHNDCFLASYTDWGTYPPDPAERDALRQYLNSDNRFVPQGGETCNPGEDAQPFIGCENALDDLELLRFSTLNRGYHPDVLQGWRNGGCYDEIDRRLGYRFVLREGEFPRSGRAGQRVGLSLQLRNEGFASPYNPRQFEVLLRPVGGGAVSALRLDTVPDPRRWLPDDGIITLALSGVIPSTVPPGQYDVLLNLPDPRPTLRTRPEYSIRLANADVWEAETGYNRLGAVISIQG